MQTSAFPLVKLLADAGRNAFMIPRFQREFVWKPTQVKLLIDSIARNYPIGSLLLLTETESEPKKRLLASRGVRATVTKTHPASQEAPEQLSYFYVLDGQQHLTSMVRVFLQASEGETFYFDLKNMKLFEDERTKSDWIISRNPARKMGREFLRSDIVIDSKKCHRAVDDYFEEYDSKKCHRAVDDYFEEYDDELTGDRNAQKEASAKVGSGLIAWTHCGGG